MRFAQMFFAILILITLGACPVIVPIAPGLWVLYIDGAETAFGVRLLEGGGAELLNPDNLPPGVDVAISSPTTWDQSGRRVTIIVSDNLPVQGITTEYTGTATSETTIENGTWEETEGILNSSGLWDAERIGD